MKSQDEINLSVALDRVTTAEAFDTVLKHFDMNMGTIQSDTSPEIFQVIIALCRRERDNLISLSHDQLKAFIEQKARQKELKLQSQSVVIRFR